MLFGRGSKKGKNKQKGLKELRFLTPLFAFFASLCSFCFLFQKRLTGAEQLQLKMKTTLKGAKTNADSHQILPHHDVFLRNFNQCLGAIRPAGPSECAVAAGADVRSQSFALQGFTLL